MIASVWPLRLDLARQGWITTLRLARLPAPGEAHAMVWLSRWDWHGRRCDRVTLHAGAKVSLDAKVEAQEQSILAIQQCFKRASNRAVKALQDFPDSIPQQGDGDELREEPVATRIIFRESRRPADHHPTEALPQDALTSGEIDLGQDEILPTALHAVRTRGDWEDELSWVGSTSPGQNQDRTWALGWKVVQREWLGQRVAYSPMRWSTSDLQGPAIATALRASEAELQAMEATYYPGSPTGSLPPGLKSFVDHMLEREAAERDRELDLFGQDRDLQDPDIRAYLLTSWQQRWSASKTLRENMAEPTSRLLDGMLASQASGPHRS